MLVFFLVFFRQWQSVTHNFGSCKKLLWDSWLKTIRPLLRGHGAGCVFDVTPILLLPNCERAVSKGSPMSSSSGRQQMCRPSSDAWIFSSWFSGMIFFFSPANPLRPRLSSMSSPWLDFWCLDKCPLIPPLSLSPVWTIYALAALLILTVIAMVAKLLLHVTVKYVCDGRKAFLFSEGHQILKPLSDGKRLPLIFTCLVAECTDL